MCVKGISKIGSASKDKGAFSVNSVVPRRSPFLSSFMMSRR
jgi:hypothetical protein